MVKRRPGKTVTAEGNITEKMKKALPRFYCRKCCLIKKSKTAFFITTTPDLDTNGYLSVCVDCCNEIFRKNLEKYNGEVIKATFYTCKTLNVKFSYNAIDVAQKHFIAKKEKGKEENIEYFFGIYKSKMMSLIQLDETASYDFLASDRYISDSDLIKIDNDTIREVTPEERRKDWVSEWGSGWDDEDYEFLEKELKELQASYACEDWSMLTVMKDMCFLNLSIAKARANGDDAIKLIESRNKVMGTAKLQPAQATGIEANDTVTFGTLIKKWENEKPIPIYLDDEMKRYIDTYYVAQIAKMEGITNEATEKFDQELEEYTIDLEGILEKAAETDLLEYDDDI